MPSPVTVHGWFARWARARPDAVALRHDGTAHTYAELDAAATAVAVALHERGVGPGHVVPVLLPRGPELVATLLAVMRCGAAYAVLDAGWPRDHLLRLLATIDGPVLVGPSPEGHEGPSMLPSAAPVTVDDVPDWPDVRGDDAACVYFTSGSTGTPKGAIAPHAGTVRLFQDCELADLGPGAAMLQAAALPWDGLTLELWSMLTTGGTALLLDTGEALDGETVRRALRDGATLLWLTSTVFNLLVEEDLGCFTGLRHLLIGGERLSPRHVGRFLEAHPSTRLTNGYGPAEATVFVTTHDVVAADLARPGGIPIGRAVGGTHLDVVEAGEPVPDGEVGELVVSGDRVALGYLGGVHDHVFSTVERDGRTVRSYATGDLVRRVDGVLEFVGRADRELKIRGHRVDPAAIEAVVGGLPGVESCRAVPVDDEDGRPREVVVFCTGEPPADGGAALVRAAAAVLPAHLTPRAVVHVDRLPVTAHGKLDVAALLDALPRGLPAAGDDVATAPADGPPPGPVEQSVLHETAALVAGPARLDHSFRDLGGSSLDLARLAMRLGRRWGVHLPLGAFARAASLREVAQVVEQALSAAPPRPTAPTPATPAPATPTPATPTPLTPMQLGFFHTHLAAPHDTSSLCLMAWEVDGALDQAAMGEALGDVRRRHEALHSRYELDDPCVARPVDVTGPVEVAALPPVEDAAEARATLVAALTSAPLDLERGEVWRVASQPVATGGSWLGLAVHHVAFDGWSEALLAADLTRAYAARRAGAAPAWDAPLPTRATVLAAAPPPRADPDDVARWREALADVGPLSLVSSDVTPCPGPCRAGQHWQEIEIPRDALERWRARAAEQGVSLLTVALGLYERAVAPFVQAPFVVGVPRSVRSSHLEEGLVGCYIDMTCLPLDPAASHDADASLRRIDALVQTSAAHPVGLADLVRAAAPRRSGRTPVYQAAFALQDNAEPVLVLDGRPARFLRPQPPHPPVELLTELHAPPGHDGRVTVSHRCRDVPTAVATGLLEALAELLLTPPATPTPASARAGAPTAG